MKMTDLRTSCLRLPPFVSQDQYQLSSWRKKGAWGLTARDDSGNCHRDEPWEFPLFGDTLIAFSPLIGSGAPSWRRTLALLDELSTRTFFCIFTPSDVVRGYHCVICVIFLHAKLSRRRSN